MRYSKNKTILLKGLFVNNAEAKDSIHLSGKMVFDCLKFCKTAQIDYKEISQEHKEIPGGYDFYLFNYHPHTMSWLDTRSLRKLLGFIGTVVLEVLPGDPFVMCPEKDFDFYCVLDPTLKSKNNRVFSFSRPLPLVNHHLQFSEHIVPVIGSFGFATKGKGFQHVVEAVNKEFDRAIIKINIPFGDFVPDSKEYATFLKNICLQKAKKGVDVIVTHDFMTDNELINWCANNTINCFLYDRKMPGLSATTDQAIVSGRPLAVSNNETFRHITHYIKPYPIWSLKESIELSVPLIKQIQKDWSPYNFASSFDKLLLANKDLLNKTDKLSESVKLFRKQNNFQDIVAGMLKKYRRKLNLQNIKSILNDRGDSKKII